jgi:hypothetical protein
MIEKFYIFFSSFFKKILPIIMIGASIFLFGGGMSYLSALVTGHGARSDIYFIITSPVMITFLFMLALGGWMTFIDAPAKMTNPDKNLRNAKMEFFLGIALIALVYMSIELLVRGGV